MFDFVHKNKRVVQVILALMTVPFAIWGIESYTRVSGGRDSVAKVNGLEISKREFDEQMNAQLEQVRRMFGGSIDPSALDTPPARQALLDSLVAQRLVASEAGRRHLFMTKDAVIEAIAQSPESARYSAYLASRNTTDQRNVAELQTQLPLARLVGSIADTAIAPREVASRLAALEAQKREVSQVGIAAQQFLSQVKVDEAQVKTHYDANAAQYRTPERVRVEYLVLSGESLMKQDPLTEAELKAAYEQRAAQFKVAESRRASHILVKTRDEADKALAELQKNPGHFAELAKKLSQDTGSAEKGGDLGMVTADSLASEKLAAAVFSMKQGETRVVESEFGFHVVRVTAVQGARARSFEDVRKELAEELGRQKGARKFTEAAETFSNLVYEQPDTLKPAAERFKLPLRTTGWVAKSSHQELGAIDNPKLVAALFSAEAIRNKRNTDAIEVAPQTLAAARVIEHQPEAQRSFDDVKGEVAETLRRIAAADLARKDGEAKLAELRQGKEPGLKWSAPRAVSRRDAQGVPADVMRQVLAADVSKLPAYAGMAFPDGYLLVRVSKVIEAEAKQPDAQTAARIAGLFGSSQYEAFVAGLRSRADVEVNSASLEKK